MWVFLLQVGVLGLNHKSANLRLREQFAEVCARRFCATRSTHGDHSYLLLSTCNRTELYFSAEDLAEAHSYFLGIIRNDLIEEFDHTLYAYFGEECFFHLARVTSGMDSAIIGETEIQGQVKRAYEEASSVRALSHYLHFLFQKCLKIGKEVRTRFFATARGMPTLEETVLHIADRAIGSLHEAKILFVGLSEINDRIYRRFRQKRFPSITFCNRSFDKLYAFALREKLSFLPWQALSNWHAFDLIIFGTKSPHRLLEAEPHLLNRKERLLLDLSVPRTVDPEIDALPNCSLYNIDELNCAVDRKRQLKAREIARIETQVIGSMVKRQVSIFKGRQEPHPSLALVGA